ncbi:exodeoxyribonuclease VII small subunit [Verrucomicrobiota bacterium]
MTAKRAVKDAKKKQDFEESLKRLEVIVNEMESGSLGLEDMITRFEEGQTLLDFCSKKLNEVERKIEILVKKGGRVTAEPFDEDQVSGSKKDEAEDSDEELF